MIELLTNMIVVTALGGACLIVVIVVVKAVIALAATQYVNLPLFLIELSIKSLLNRVLYN